MVTVARETFVVPATFRQLPHEVSAWSVSDTGSSSRSFMQPTSGATARAMARMDVVLMPRPFSNTHASARDAGITFHCDEAVSCHHTGRHSACGSGLSWTHALGARVVRARVLLRSASGRG